MSEEILAKESEEKTEEELAEKRKAAAEQDSSDEKDEDTEVDEGKTSKASVKKEDEEEDEEVEESTESEASDQKEEDDEEEVPAEALKIPKTKNGMLSAVYEKLNGLKKDELKAKYEQILKASTIVEEDEAEEPEEEVKEKRTKVAVKAEDLNIDVKDDVEALVQG